MKFSFKRGSGGFRRFLEVEGAHPKHRFVFLFHPLVFTCLGQTPGQHGHDGKRVGADHHADWGARVHDLFCGKPFAVPFFFP